MSVSRHSEYLANLPATWKQITIRELGTVYAGGTPSRINPSYWNGPISWVTPSELTNLRTKEITKTRDTITESGLTDSSATLLPAGSLIVTTRATIGNVAVAGIPLSTNQGFKNIVLSGEADADFYYHLLKFISQEFIRLASGTTFLEISAKDFSSVIVPLLPLPEQRRIAEILDAADEAIRQTERVIAKLQAVKAGLLHDLLTRGLDEHGHLRDPQAHPEQFKDSPLGRIPREWEVRTIAELGGRKPSAVQTGPFGAQLHSEDYVDEGVPFILIRNLQESGLDTSDMPHITYRDAQRLSLYALEPGDTVFSRVGRVGSCFLVEEEQAGWVISGQMLRIRLPHDVVDHRYLVHALRSKPSQDQITGASVGTTRQSINTQILESLRILVPSVVEQRRIAAVLDAHDARIRAEEAELAKLRQVKRGLMDDLLTGRVRVA